MNGLVEAATAIGLGLASALLPVVGADAYAVVAGHRGGHAAATVIALALGQTIGKVLVFESARRGTGRLGRLLVRRGRSGRAAGRAARWTQPIRRWLSRRRTALPTVLVSAAIGVPPLAVVSVVAGTADLRRWEFTVGCLLGRTIRFAVLAFPVAALG